LVIAPDSINVNVLSAIREFERLSHEGQKIGEEETADASTAGPARRKSRSGSSSSREAELPPAAPGSSPRSGPRGGRGGAEEGKEQRTEEEQEQEQEGDDDADDTSCGVEEEGQAPKASDMLIKESKV
jgi:hypothetical protein